MIVIGVLFITIDRLLLGPFERLTVGAGRLKEADCEHVDTAATVGVRLVGRRPICGST